MEAAQVDEQHLISHIEANREMQLMSREIRCESEISNEVEQLKAQLNEVYKQIIEMGKRLKSQNKQNQTSEASNRGKK